jgi:hypothetical protein
VSGGPLSACFPGGRFAAETAQPNDHGWERLMLRGRLPADLRDTPSGPDFDALPFTSLYLIDDDEWAAGSSTRPSMG